MTEDDKNKKNVANEKQTIADANKIAKKESERNKSFEGVTFDSYLDVGGDRMYRKMEGGSIKDTFTQEEMDQAIEARKEDPFYNFEKDEKNVTPFVQEFENQTQDNFSIPDDSGGSADIWVVKGGLPQKISIKTN